MAERRNLSKKIKIWIQENVVSIGDFELLKTIISESRNWTDFRGKAENSIGGKLIERW